MYQMKKMFKLKVITESLMLPLTQRENALKDSGLVPSKWDGKWTNSQETSIFFITITQSKSQKLSESDHQEYQHTAFWIKLLPGQELDCTRTFKRIQKLQKNSKMILTRTFTTQDQLRTLSEQDQLQLETYKVSTETVEVSLSHEQFTLNNSKINDNLNHQFMACMHFTQISYYSENYHLHI